MPIAFYSISLAVISAVASIILFLNYKRDHLLAPEEFFKNYSRGFFLLTFVNLPIILINLGVHISYNLLVILYAISFFTVFFAYLFFYKGTLMLCTKDHFFRFAPFVFLPLFAIVSIIPLIFRDFNTFLIYTAMDWGFLFPIAAYLGSLFFYFYIKGAPYDTMQRKPYAIIFGLSWFFILGLDFYLWVTLANYPNEFWILKVAEQKTFFMLRGLAYLFMLSGILIYSKHLRNICPKENEQH